MWQLWGNDTLSLDTKLNHATETDDINCLWMPHQKLITNSTDQGGLEKVQPGDDIRAAVSTWWQIHTRSYDNKWTVSVANVQSPAHICLKALQNPSSRTSLRQYKFYYQSWKCFPQMTWHKEKTVYDSFKYKRTSYHNTTEDKPDQKWKWPSSEFMGETFILKNHQVPTLH